MGVVCWAWLYYWLLYSWIVVVFSICWGIGPLVVRIYFSVRRCGFWVVCVCVLCV
jgi:hypothetical protein